MMRILLVDDDLASLNSTRKILELAGHEVVTARDGACALEQVRPGRQGEAAQFDVIVSDVRMPNMSGLEFLKTLSALDTGLPIILMTAYGSVNEAVWAMKLGAVDFLLKPFKRQQLLTAVQNAFKRRRSTGRSGSRTESVGDSAIIGSCAAMQELKKVIQKVAPTDATVLLTGESGTGKELFARSIHLQSTRTEQPFVAINCASIPENLMESELFGYEKGAFTGADSKKIGLFEAASGGTLFLDEVGDLPPALQPKILRALQEREVRRLGSNEPLNVNVRVIAATHQDLRQMVGAGSFREDLWFRLDVVNFSIPPLRERGEDLAELVLFFLKRYALIHNKPIAGIEAGALEVLRRHRWPGNVRELSNVIERAVVFSSEETGRIQIADFPPHLVALGADLSQSSGWGGKGEQVIIPIGTSLKDALDLLIRKTLEATAGDKNVAARILGINSRTVYRKLGSKLPPDPSAQE